MLGYEIFPPPLAGPSVWSKDHDVVTDDSMRIDVDTPPNGSRREASNSLQMFDPASLEKDVLDTLLQMIPEYSWEAQAKAAVPARLAPPMLYVNTRPANVASVSGLEDGNGTIIGIPSSLNLRADEAIEKRSSSRRSTDKRRKSATLARAVIPADEWEDRTFPFGHAPHYPPRLPEPLLLMEHNTGNKFSQGTPANDKGKGRAMSDHTQNLAMFEPPLTSIISSPYVRIPPYTFCARTSVSWRPNAYLRSRCHMSFLPFFGEDNYEDESEFRDRINQSTGRIAFHIPTENEADRPPHLPDHELCGICLSRACIVHHFAPAVPLPQPHGEAGVNGPLSAGPESSFAMTLSASNSVLGSGTPRNRFAGPIRSKRQRDRSDVGCGAECYLRVDRGSNTAAAAAFEQWSQADKDEFNLVMGSMTSETTACIFAAFMSRRVCHEVEPILTERLRLESRLSQAEDEMGGSIRNGSFKKHKRLQSGSNVLHEMQTQREIEPPWVAAADTNEFSTEELRMRVPRTVLPWQPCYHPGRPCSSFTGKEDPGEDESDPYCTCKRNGTWCEPGCGCPLDCGERFAGCKCAANGKECKGGQEDARGKHQPGCPCIDHMRECHPELCAGHTDKHCKGMAVQADNAIRTFIGPSDLEGYGLFVGEDVQLSRIYIGEYRGELINEHEAQMRSLLYQTRARSFLFDVTQLGIVDGLRLGNKTRYINTGRNKSKNTCAGESTMINGQAKLIINAHKSDGRLSLKKNDELLLDYGGNFELFGEDS